MDFQFVHFNKASQAARSVTRSPVVVVRPGYWRRWSPSVDRRDPAPDWSSTRGRLDLRIAIPLVVLISALLWWALIETVLIV